ncbi:hypothetical protein N802_11115 [Knoellia sinensis KCTC 19936]|uniref:Autoinducer 2 import ATP-binding protein LsrA n=1 Tax=Knoellia sinensis KCTC 19936 TaxID=1385520 RepID=A0A0A0J9A2_9MICO|nr:ATP-binding cassette domain-containing protein [Knoellia sinensis]KGN32191.1 hypothetical protein N802_11115 [Knoellia sinensis KCTC 19936]
MEVLVQAAGVHQYRGVRHVLKGVDLTIHRGEIVGLIGQNGSGKSTLIQVLSGILRPELGRIDLAGEFYRPESVDAARAAGVSVIEQDFESPAGQTVAEAMYRHTFMAGRPHAELLEPAKAVMARTQFEVDLDAITDTLDPAEQAIVEVLRVLAEEAQLVVFDEASSMLHEIDIVQLHAAARRLRDHGCAVLYVAHRLEEVVAISDRVAVMRQGQIVSVVDAREATVDGLAHAMLQRPIGAAAARDKGPLGDVRLAVQGLSVGKRLKDVAVDLRVGEVLGVVGLRESGAHELIEAVAGVRPSASGSVHLNGEQLGSLHDAGDRIRYLPSNALQDDEKISDLLASGAKGETELARLRHAVAVAHHLELSTSDIQGPMKSLSGGDRQKVSVAETLASGADVIVLNHPTRGVDVGVKDRVHSLIRDLVDDGTSVVFFASNVEELLAHSDRVAVVHDGQIVAVLDPAEVDEDIVMDYAAYGEVTQRQARGA